MFFIINSSNTAIHNKRHCPSNRIAMSNQKLGGVNHAYLTLVYTLIMIISIISLKYYGFIRAKTLSSMSGKTEYS